MADDEKYTHDKDPGRAARPASSGCPTCGSLNLIRADEVHSRAYNCEDCGQALLAMANGRYFTKTINRPTLDKTGGKSQA